MKFDDGSFEQPAQPGGEPWTVERTLEKPGGFAHHCEFHGSAMTGRVEVRDATRDSAQTARRTTEIKP